MNALRHCLALILLLAVTLSGAQSAMAQAEMAMATYPVLCSQDGAAAEPMAFSPAGKPMPVRHACPHCLAAAGTAGALPLPLPGLLPFLAFHDAAFVIPAAQHHAPQPLLRPSATGPPLRL